MIENTGGFDTMRYWFVCVLVILIMVSSYAALPYYIENPMLYKILLKKFKFDFPKFSKAVIYIETIENKDAVTIYIYTSENNESIPEQKYKMLTKFRHE